MATKTISLREEAYERLRRAKRGAESFSDVVMRAEWPELGVTAEDLLELYARRGPFFSEATLARVEEAKSSDRPPEDKWAAE